MYTERQQEIMQAALELISEKGIQGLTTKNLSLKIGISEPALYRHFENKNKILLSILDSLKKNSTQFFDSQKHSTENSLVKIEQLFFNHFQSFIKRPVLTSIVFSEDLFRNEPELMSKMKDVIFHNQVILMDIISEGKINGEIRSDIDTRVMAIMIMGSLRLFITEWQMDQFKFDLINEGKLLIDNIMKLIKI